MSRVSSAILIEKVTAGETIANSKPVLVHVRQEEGLAERVMRRVAEVVEMQLANGSMPA